MSDQLETHEAGSDRGGEASAPFDPLTFSRIRQVGETLASCGSASYWLQSHPSARYALEMHTRDIRAAHAALTRLVALLPEQVSA